MPIEFRCPACDKLLRTTDGNAGLTANCPDCGELVDVPSPAQDVQDARFGAGSEFGRPLPSASAPFHTGENSTGFWNEADAERSGSREGNPGEEREDAPFSLTRPCPVCGERIAVEAVLCRYCGEQLKSSGSTAGQSNSLALASLILGIIAIPMLCVCYTGIPLGIAAVTMGIIAMKQCNRGEGSGKELAMIGIACGAIPSLLGALVVAWMVLSAVVRM